MEKEKTAPSKHQPVAKALITRLVKRKEDLDVSEDLRNVVVGHLLTLCNDRNAFTPEGENGKAVSHKEFINALLDLHVAGDINLTPPDLANALNKEERVHYIETAYEKVQEARKQDARHKKSYKESSRGPTHGYAKSGLRVYHYDTNNKSFEIE